MYIEDYATLASSFGHLGRNFEEAPAMIEKYNALAIPAPDTIRSPCRSHVVVLVWHCVQL